MTSWDYRGHKNGLDSNFTYIFRKNADEEYKSLFYISAMIMWWYKALKTAELNLQKPITLFYVFRHDLPIIFGIIVPFVSVAVIYFIFMLLKYVPLCRDSKLAIILNGKQHDFWSMSYIVRILLVNCLLRREFSTKRTYHLNLE